MTTAINRCRGEKKKKRKKEKRKEKKIDSQKN